MCRINLFMVSKRHKPYRPHRIQDISTFKPEGVSASTTPIVPDLGIHLFFSAPLVAITGKKKGAHSLSVLPTEALRKPYPVTGGNAPRGHVPFSGPDNEISQVSVGPLKLKRLKRLSCLRAVYQIPRDASTGHAAAAKHSTGRHRTRHSLGSGVLAFRGDRASPVLIQHIR